MLRKAKRYAVIAVNNNIKNVNIKGSWTGLFKELPNGNIELSFTEEIEAGNFFMKLFAKPCLKAQQKRYMRDLENRIEQL